jgi:hypothetical protein
LIITKQATQSFDGFFTRKLKEILSEPKQSRNTRVIRPSQITECVRWLTADILGIAPAMKVTPQLQRIFDNGTYVHKRYLKKYLLKMGIASKVKDTKTGTEEPFIEMMLHDDKTWVKGAPDAVVVNPEDGLQYIFELKSINDYAFKKLMQPEEAHILQVHLYMMLLPDIPRAVIFYESKDGQATKEFVILKSDALVKYLENRIALIQKYVTEYPTTQVLPLCEFPNENHCNCEGIK